MEHGGAGSRVARGKTSCVVPPTSENITHSVIDVNRVAKKSVVW